MPSATKINQKDQKETTKEGGISSTIVDQKSFTTQYITPSGNTTKTLGFNHDHHPYRMCNETGIPEFLELQIPGIPMVVMVTSRSRSLRYPTQQDFIHACTLPIYECHTRFKF